MANINIDDYIKDMDLSPELAEKASACKTSSELMELAAENDAELSLDELNAVAGGVSYGEPITIISATIPNTSQVEPKSNRDNPVAPEPSAELYARPSEMNLGPAEPLGY
ncbi:MAG: hypothetical protein IJ740_06860 [Ruminococcus sp.]|nr:hypothetical protein [Ruminococcus sp.]